MLIVLFTSERVNMPECAPTVRVGRLGDAPTRRCSHPGEGPGLCSVTWSSEVTSSETADTHCIRSASHTVDTFHSELPWALGRVSAENRLGWIGSERISFSSRVCICSIGAIIHFALVNLKSPRRKRPKSQHSEEPKPELSILLEWEQFQSVL